MMVEYFDSILLFKRFPTYSSLSYVKIYISFYLIMSPLILQWSLDIKDLQSNSLQQVFDFYSTYSIQLITIHSQHSNSILLKPIYLAGPYFFLMGLLKKDIMYSRFFIINPSKSIYLLHLALDSMCRTYFYEVTMQSCLNKEGKESQMTTLSSTAFISFLH